MSISFLILFILLLLFSTYLGFQLGQAIGKRAITTSDYWKMNIAAVAVAVVLTVFLASLPLLWAVIIGLLAGSLAGMKMSFGESVGPWKKADEYFNINKAHREAAKRGDGEKKRRARREGIAGPDLISTENSPSDVQKNAR